MDSNNIAGVATNYGVTNAQPVAASSNKLQKIGSPYV